MRFRRRPGHRVRGLLRRASAFLVPAAVVGSAAAAKGLRAALLALVASVLGAGELRAQEATREVQVPFDSVRAVLEVGPDLRRELGLFPGVAGFEAARLFLVGGGRTVLEITAREDSRLVRERRALSASELDDLRARLAAAFDATGASTRIASAGRGGLVLAETALGLAFYGWALPEVLGIDSARGNLAAYLLIAGASFYVPYRVTSATTVSRAHRDAVVWGATRGIAYGALLGDLLTLGDDGAFAGPGDDDTDTRAILGLGILGSLGGQVLGYQAVGAAGADRGDVALWSSVGDLGLAGGFAAALALGLYDSVSGCSGDVCVEVDVEATRAGHAATLALGAASLWGAYRWSRARDYTVGDARALLSFSILGAQAALPAAWAAFEDAEEGERAMAAALLAGAGVGLWLGDGALRPHALSDSDGLLVQAGHVAGGLLGLGVTYLLDGGTRIDEAVYLGAAAAGSALGSLLTFRAVAGGGSERGEAGAAGFPATLRFMPTALLMALVPVRSGAAVRAPLLSVRF